MSDSRSQTTAPRSRPQSRSSLHGIAIFLIAACTLIQERDRAFADGITDPPRSPNIVVILADDK